MKKPFLIAIVLLLTFNSCTNADKQETEESVTVDATKTVQKKILFVLTNHNVKGDTGESTGFYLSEAAHPWKVLSQAGYEIDFVSPKGGKAPVDGFDLSDEINAEFWNDDSVKKKIDNTLIPSEIKPSDYLAIHYVGGHGTMWDFPNNEALAKIATSIYESGGAISAVCHGPAALINIKLSDSSYLVDGKKVSAFTNEEEIALELEDIVPFMLETTLKERGAIFEKSALWQEQVSSDQRLITGQNPASASKLGEMLLKEIKKNNN